MTEFKRKSWLSVYINVVATLIAQGRIEKSDKDMMKEKLGSIYMDILSINIEDIHAQYWRPEMQQYTEINFFSYVETSKPPFVKNIEKLKFRNSQLSQIL